MGGGIRPGPAGRGLRPKAETHTAQKAPGDKMEHGVLCGILDAMGVVKRER